MSFCIYVTMYVCSSHNVYLYICLFSILVNIYGSQEMFVIEYRNLLADRLLQSLNYDTTKEVCVCMCVCVCIYVYILYVCLCL